MGSNLSRDAVERVLARATELQALASTSSSADPEGTISEAQLLEIAREAGLSPTSVRQAIAEERARIMLHDAGTDSDPAWLTRRAPRTVAATRMIRGTTAPVIAVLDAWMVREECLRTQRRFADSVVWEARNDWVSAIRRGLHVGGKTYYLSLARHVTATVVPANDEQVVVRLEADLTPHRTTRLRLGTVAGIGGTAAAGAVAAVGIMAHVALLPLALVAALPAGVGALGARAALRAHRTFAERIAIALEQALDRLEHQSPPVSGSLLDAVRPLLR